MLWGEANWLLYCTLRWSLNQTGKKSLLKRRLSTDVIQALKLQSFFSNIFQSPFKIFRNLILRPAYLTILINFTCRNEETLSYITRVILFQRPWNFQHSQECSTRWWTQTKSPFILGLTYTTLIKIFVPCISSVMHNRKKSFSNSMGHSPVSFFFF